MAEFVFAILEGKDPQYSSLEFALQVMRAYEAVLMSQGNWVEL